MRKIFAFFLFAILIGGYTVAADNYDFPKTSNGITLYYKITSSTSPYTVEVVPQNSSSPYYTTYPSGSLSIPSSVTYNSKTYSVTSIGDYAFYSCTGLTSVTIPSSITSISNNASFPHSSLTSITVNSSNTVYDSRNNCNAIIKTSTNTLICGCKNTIIPSTVTSIGDRAFANCSGLTTVSIPNSVRSIGTSAFSDCSGLTSATIGNSVESIGERAFYNCTGLTSITIPNSVTSIGYGAFCSCSGLTGTLTIPNSVTSIGNSAFEGCSGLTSVTIGNSVTSIGNSAFYGCSGLTSVYYNGNLAGWCGITFGNTSIYANPLYYAGDLYIDSELVMDLIIPETIMYINPCAFSGATCLKSVIIPNSVRSIGNQAFQNCARLTSVTIGNSVASVGHYAFEWCSELTNVYYTGDIASWCEIAFDGNYYEAATPLYYAKNFYVNNELIKDLIIPESITEILAPTFCQAKCFTSITIPSSVTSIGANAFCGCNMNEITIPSSVTSIGNAAFYNCTGLTTVNFNAINCTAGTSFSSILFNGCSSFTTLNIGNDVMNIPDYAFYNCSELVNIYSYVDEPPTIQSHTFSSGSNATIYVPCGSATAYSSATGWSNFSDIRERMTTYSISASSTNTEYGTASVTQQPNCTDGTAIIEATPNDGYAFAAWNDGNTDNPRTLTVTHDTVFTAEFELGRCLIASGTCGADGDNLTWELSCDSVLTISGSGAMANYGFDDQPWYSNKEKIHTVIIEDGVTSIGNSAFYGCSGLTCDLTIPENCISIGSNAFRGCSGLTGTLTIPNSVTSIGNGAFSDCSGLTEVTIPNSVTSIGNYAFSDCVGLTGELTIPEYCISIGSNAFRGCSGLTGTLTIPNSVTSIGNYAFYNCTGLTSVTIGNSVREIGEYTFYGCQGLVSLSIGNSVENIGELAFGYCENISSIITSAFPPPTLDEHVFFYINIYDFDYSSITVWTPCDYVERYSLQWSNFSDIRGHFIYTLSVSSENPQQGTASVTQQPDCSNNGVAIIEATPNDGFAFAAWNDGNTENPRSVTVTSDTSFTASYGILYTIAVVSSNEDYGTVSGDGSYVEGSQIEISATPIEHYHFVQWNDGITENPRTITVTSDSTFTAEFAIDQFTVIVSANDEEMGAVSGGNTYDYGTETQISATANEHYHFVQWSDGNMENPRTITVTSDSTFTAEFAIDQFTVIVSANDEEMGAVDGNGTLNYGAEVQISATPIACHRFVQWNDGNTDNPRTITVTEDASYTANFETYQLEVSLSAEPIGCYGGTTNITNTVSNGTEPYSYAWSNGESSQNLNDVSAGTYSVTVTDAQTCTATASVTITQPDELTASLSATEIIYSGETSDITNTVSGGTVPYNYAWCNGATTQNLAGVSAGTYSVTVTDANGCTASTSIEIAGPQSYNIVANSNNDSYGSVSGGGTYDAGQTATLTATANEHYHFVQWNDGNTENPRSITVTSDSTFTATFAIDQHTITVVSSNETMGTVSGGGTFDYGATATLTATPAEGYEFVSWNDGNTENPRQITVIGDGIYVASFSEASQTTNYTITAVSANPNYGTVTGGGTYAEGTEVTLTATPNEGYEFVQWNDENTDNPRNITVTENAIYIATFAVVTIPTIYNEFSATACESYTWNDSIFNESGDYTQTFTATNSADSIVTLHLTIYPLPQPEITVDGILDACNPETASVTLSTEEFDSYIWS
ncbi:MAG: leucine-rich repeat domain-containing protein, partial [Bacteroidales bacterium]|nr:leucine-rich repeat domain-containing protein [Bacteroidales bacterium]